MAIIQTIVDAMKAIIVPAVGLATPPAGSYNFYTSVIGITANFVTQVARGKVQLPCVVLEIGDFMPDTEFGVGDVLTKRMPVTIHYIDALAGPDGDQDSVAQQAFNIGVAFDSQPSFPNWLIIEPCVIMSNVDAAVNAPIAGASRVSVLSASASWSPGFQVQLVNS